MNQLVPIDVMRCVGRLADPVSDLLKNNPGSVFLAGGFVRSVIANEPIADVDLFISAAQDAEKHLRSLFGRPQVPTDLVSYTQNAATVLWRPRVQIIHRWTFASAADGIERFDFTIARAAIWFDGHSWQSVCADSYYADLAAKRIVYCAPTRDEEPGGSLLRLLKFYRRGYCAPLDTVGAILARIAKEIDVDDELAAAAEFTRRLREVDPRDARAQAIPIAAAPDTPTDDDEEVQF